MKSQSFRLRERPSARNPGASKSNDDQNVSSRGHNLTKVKELIRGNEELGGYLLSLSLLSNSRFCDGVSPCQNSL